MARRFTEPGKNSIWARLLLTKESKDGAIAKNVASAGNQFSTNF